MKNTATSYKAPICRVITCYGMQQICQPSLGLFGNAGEQGEAGGILDENEPLNL